MNRPKDNLADDDALKVQLVEALEKRRRNTRPDAEAPRVIPALVLARYFGIRRDSSDDSRKRGVRDVVQRLRRDGVPVLANRLGYYLPLSAAALRGRSRGIPSIPKTQRPRPLGGGRH